jgi:hypothetical protein
MKDESGKQKVESRKRKWKNMNVCQNVSLWGPLAAAFGEETKCPTRIQGNLRFNMQNLPSTSGLIYAAKLRLVKAN